MDPTFRTAFNAAYSPELYRRYLARVEGELGHEIPFRVAETPLFFPTGLRDRLARHATEIVEQISRPSVIERCQAAVPAHLDVPGRDALSNCIQVDFAIVRNADGELDGRLVELQGFPSLYALTPLQADAWAAELKNLPGLDRPWTVYFNGLDRAAYESRLRRALLAGADPEHVVLMDLDPPQQKTYPDFLATQRLLGIDPVCPTALEREGRTLFRRKDGRRVPIRRIYNRVVFDELIRKGAKLPFGYTDDLDVTWVPHPNWYWVWSKYTVPFLDHPSVPRARFVSDVKTLPDDLDNYVLKPLFSFAGTGVVVDVLPETVNAIPEAQRHEWVLQEKIHYAPDLKDPQGQGIKAEVRMMFLRAPDMEKPELVLNLVRLSRGKLLGVDHNKGFDWVGGTIGIHPSGG